jgi:biopolymer transport protein ExbB/TolQ
MAIKKTPGHNRPSSLVQPVLLGMILFLGFAGLSGVASFQSPWIQRYMFGHAINRMSSALFFVGVAAVALAAWNVWNQRRNLSRIGLGYSGAEPNDESDERCENEREEESRLATRLMERLSKLSAKLQNNVLARRLNRVLGVIERDGAELAIYNRLDQLAEEDAEYQSQRYAFPRILVWATPLLGFLGTVLGISEAMGGLSVGGESDLQQMMGGLQSNLNMAFDTTAQALVLSIVLMFGVFAIERQETVLLSEVTARTEGEICNWFVLADVVVPVGLPQPDSRLLEELQAQAKLLAQTAAAEVTQAWKSAAKHQSGMAESANKSFQQLHDGLRELSKQKAEEIVAVWSQSAEKHFEVLASQPTASHRIESALIQLTTAVGELQRMLNQQRPESVLAKATVSATRPKPESRPTVVFERPEIQRPATQRKAA